MFKIHIFHRWKPLISHFVVMERTLVYIWQTYASSVDVRVYVERCEVCGKERAGLEGVNVTRKVTPAFARGLIEEAKKS